MSNLYAQRGVSAQKEDVHQAIKHLSEGLYPKAFCKIYPDYLTQDEEYGLIAHADGAGTKSILAYLYWKETGDLSVWKNIAEDAIFMNLDDIFCVGPCKQIAFTSTIDRNKLRIPGEVLEAIIEGNRACFEKLHQYGIQIHYLGGETADVGDVVRTIAVNGNMTTRIKKANIISNQLIAENQVIVGFASFGKCVYENEYNSGIGSNGLTSARHDMLHKYYAETYPETYETTLSSNVSYIGNYKLTDSIANSNFENVGKMLLSPTRTYAPLLLQLFNTMFNDIYGIIHCSGGGQTKCLKYVPSPIKIVKNNLFAPPTVFELIQQQSNASWQEMYQVFNMGHRLEIFTNEVAAFKMINVAAELGIDAQVIGYTTKTNHQQAELILEGKFGTLCY